MDFDYKKFAYGILFGFFIGIIFALPTLWLWNGCLVPAVTFAKNIGFWQAFGLNLLTAIMFRN